jgi:serine/threonine protein kinase
MSRKWRAVVAIWGLFGLLFALAGCEPRSEAIVLERWSLEVGGTLRGELALPEHFDDRLAPGDATYTLRSQVALPESYRGRVLTLAFPNLSALSSLRVNGREVAPLDPSITAGYRVPGSQRFRISDAISASGALDLELSVRHTWTQSAWIDAAPRLSATEQGDTWVLFVKTYNEASAICGLATCALVGFSYGIVFLTNRRRGAYGWFALEALAGCAYPAFMLGVSQSVFGTADVAMLSTFLCLGTLGAIRFVHAHYDLGPPPKALFWVWVAIALWNFAFAGPFQSTRYVAPVTVVVLTSNVVYQAWLFSRLVGRKPRPKNVYVILLAWPLAALIGGSDFATWLGAGELFGGVRNGCAALAIVAFLRTAALSREHQRSLDRSAELNQALRGRVSELEERNREVQRLNDELRHQVNARSQQFADALARIGASHSGLVSLEAGEIVAARYRIVRPIGTGGMGSVYEVERLSDGRRLALKVLGGLRGAFALARFAREAQLASQVDHPNVVAVVDVDVAESGFLFLVMELVSGLTVADQKERYGDIDWALSVLRGVACGLAAVHAAGIVHRDLKPANVLTTAETEGPEEVVKITDFGIASLAEEVAASSAGETTRDDGTIAAGPAALRKPRSESMELPRAVIEAASTGGSRGERPRSSMPPPVTPLTETGVVMGTPLYMAPELLAGAKNARPASDIFSFGVIAYEILSGHHPFPARKHARGGAVVPSDPARPLREVVTKLDASLASFFDACLSEDPLVRPTAAALVEALGAESHAERKTA